MGTDIHSIAQVMKNGEWTTACTRIAGDNRCYDTFAILNNVRNGYGFAGVSTGGTFVPMAVNGLPSDLLWKINGNMELPIAADTPSDCEYNSNDGHIWLGYHSFNHCSLADLSEYWTKHKNDKIVKRGLVEAAHFERLHSDGVDQPTSYSHGVWGVNVAILSAADYIKAKTNSQLDTSKEYYVEMIWTTTYAELTHVQAIIQRLEQLASEARVTAHEVRLVFGFDS